MRGLLVRVEKICTVWMQFTHRGALGKQLFVTAICRPRGRESPAWPAGYVRKRTRRRLGWWKRPSGAFLELIWTLDRPIAWWTGVPPRRALVARSTVRKAGKGISKRGLWVKGNPTYSRGSRATMSSSERGPRPRASSRVCQMRGASDSTGVIGGPNLDYCGSGPRDVLAELVDIPDDLGHVHQLDYQQPYDATDENEIENHVRRRKEHTEGSTVVTDGRRSLRSERGRCSGIVSS